MGLNFSITDLLPVTVLAALALFILKETLEAVRRFNANRRKLSALKRILARELEIDAYVIWNLKHAAEHMGEVLQGELGTEAKYRVTKDAAGIERFEVWIDDAQLHSTSPLHKIRDEAMLRHLLDIASLDKKLFQEVEAAIDAAADARHVWNGVLDFDQSHTHASGFSDWAPKYLDASLPPLRKLYKSCTGLSEFRKRTR